ncbi:MAG: DUF6614 family protein [Candidatus Hydrogenedentota bacterium]
MNYYEIYFDLQDSTRDLDFCERLSKYMGYLEGKGLIEGYTLKRRKLGFGPRELGEFNATIRVKDMAQLELAFSEAATRGPNVEPLHKAVYSQVTNLSFALTRDFPDPVRVSPGGG